jgi:hypothetical protein
LFFRKLKKAYRLEPLILKHYSTKAPVDLQKAADSVTKITYKELNEKRAALNVDLKSTLFPRRKDKKKEKDSKSAELTQVETTSTLTASNTAVVSSGPQNQKASNQIDQVGT